MTTQNGASRNGVTKTPPSIEDLFLVSEKASPNVIIEMITTSTNPQEYIPRSHVSARQAAALQRIHILFSVWKKREVNIGQVVWNNLAYTIAEDGRGRSQAVSMLSGMRERVAAGLAGIGRGRDNNMLDGTGGGKR
ncbi:MAG: hypothetical protein OXH22_07165 [Chloroflexi bacterium]|nr:hypothetical protein [Chloroflexota bacterium]